MTHSLSAPRLPPPVPITTARTLRSCSNALNPHACQFSLPEPAPSPSAPHSTYTGNSAPQAALLPPASVRAGECRRSHGKPSSSLRPRRAEQSPPTSAHLVRSIRRVGSWPSNPSSCPKCLTNALPMPYQCLTNECAESENRPIHRRFAFGPHWHSPASWNAFPLPLDRQPLSCESRSLASPSANVYAECHIPTLWLHIGPAMPSALSDALPLPVGVIHLHPPVHHRLPPNIGIGIVKRIWPNVIDIWPAYWQRLSRVQARSEPAHPSDPNGCCRALPTGICNIHSLVVGPSLPLHTLRARATATWPHGHMTIRFRLRSFLDMEWESLRRTGSQAYRPRRARLKSTAPSIRRAFDYPCSCFLSVGCHGHRRFPRCPPAGPFSPAMPKPACPALHHEDPRAP